MAEAFIAIQRCETCAKQPSCPLKQYLLELAGETTIQDTDAFSQATSNYGPQATKRFLATRFNGVANPADPNHLLARCPQTDSDVNIYVFEEPLLDLPGSEE